MVTTIKATSVEVGLKKEQTLAQNVPPIVLFQSRRVKVY